MSEYLGQSEINVLQEAKPFVVSEYLGQSEINVLQEAKPFVTMVFQN